MSISIADVMGAIQKRLNTSNFRIAPFTYTSEFLPITGPNTGTDSFNVSNAWAFGIIKTCATVATDANGAGSATVQGYGNFASATAPLMIQITDTVENFADAPVPIDNWFGTARRPFYWEPIRIVDPNATVTITCQNLTAATALYVRLAFIGVKIFFG